MLPSICLILALLVATPVWSQATPDDESRMLIPPPVSVEAYPTTVGDEERSNYLATGLILNTAYNDNVLAGGSTTPVRDVSYSIRPTMTLNLTTPRQKRTLTYSPGFTFYQHTSALNAADQSAALNFQYRLSQHTTLSVNDSFQKSSNVFNQPNSPSGAGISGSAQSPSTGVVVPYADQLSNTANIGLSYQFSMNSMMGVGGMDAQSNYPNPAQASGLYDSNSIGGSVFYSQRLSRTQYVGLTYQYRRSQSNPVSAQPNPENSQIEVQTQTVAPFYTIYLNTTLSLSFSGGPQHVDASQSLSPTFRSWMPSAMASIGWQRSRTNFVASYSRTTTGGVGLPGVFDSTSTTASAQWQLTRTWIIGAASSYVINRNDTPHFSSTNPGGHSVSGTGSVVYSISDHFKAELGYVRLHQSYSGIAAISNAPDSDREFLSVSYQFTRSLGR